MLKRLHLKNFKAWADSSDIELAPITVLFGTNSSGKTSLHQSLMMLKQTALSKDRQRVLHFGDSRTLVDLGIYSDVVFNHQDDHPIEILLSWAPPKPGIVEDAVHATIWSYTQVDFSVSVSTTKTGQLGVNLLQYLLRDPRQQTLSVTLKPIESGRSKKYEISTEGYSLVRQPGRVWQLPPPVHCYGFPDEAQAYFQNTGFLADLTLAFEQLMHSIYYVGPIREYPHRMYPWSGEVPEHVGQSGERAVEAILAAQGRSIARSYKKRAEAFQPLIARWLKQMELIDNFEARPLAKHRKEYEAIVRRHPGGPQVNLTDVGFGLSQVLPIIVECFYVPAHSIIVFEQPEIHLHPLVQASLADLFIEAIRSRENGEDRGLQIIVETHSEHFLRRLQRRIAEEELSSKEAALYFCRSTPHGSMVDKLNVDMFGNISNWPDRFFGDDIADIAAMTNATIQRQQDDVKG